MTSIYEKAARDIFDQLETAVKRFVKSRPTVSVNSINIITFCFYYYTTINPYIKGFFL